MAVKVTSRGDRSHQTPELLRPGTVTKHSPSLICASEGCLSTEPEQLGPGKCTQPRAGPRRFPAEHRRARAVCAPREGTGPAGLRNCVHTTVLFVCSIPPPHSTTELVSLKNQQTEEVKQRNHLGSDSTRPTSEKGQIYLYYFYNHSFFSPLFFFSFFLTFLNC